MAWFWMQDYNWNRTHENLNNIRQSFTGRNWKTLIRTVSDKRKWTYTIQCYLKETDKITGYFLLFLLNLSQLRDEMKIRCVSGE